MGILRDSIQRSVPTYGTHGSASPEYCIILNPLLVSVMAEGYLYNLSKNAPLVKKNGTAIILHPCTDKFDRDQHAVDVAGRGVELALRVHSGLARACDGSFPRLWQRAPVRRAS